LVKSISLYINILHFVFRSLLDIVTAKSVPRGAAQQCHIQNSQSKKGYARLGAVAGLLVLSGGIALSGDGEDEL
jgi:hypothetical protein